MRIAILSLSLLALLSSPAFAALNVVATLPWIGSLARQIGGDRISVVTLVKPSQNPHYVEAKPSMIAAGRRADILMYNGLDLEIGYLPLILESSKNPRIMPGRPGNFDCAKFVAVLEKQGTADRSMGDIHPLGNPHYHFSGANILRVAEGMAQQLAALDHANADFYRTNFRSFSAKLAERQRQWNSVNLKGKRYLAYHRLFEYLASDYGFRIVGYLEPKPGIPPSAAHLDKLIEKAKVDRPSGIIVSSAHGLKEAESLGARTGTRVIVLPQDVGALPGTEEWFLFMDKVISALR